MKQFLAFFAFLAVAVASHAETLPFQNKRYTYALFQPAGDRNPAILLLHGAGGMGRDMLDLWKPFAQAHGITLIAPDMPRELAFEAIAPDFFRALVDAVNAIDRNRVYVFGYSMGGYLAYDAAMFGSDYFAAVGVYANCIAPEYLSIVKSAKRKIPIAIYAGVRDEMIPIASVRATRDFLEQRAFPVHYREFARNGHDYGTVAKDVNADVWEFFERVKLKP